jgi:hypothetical protein
MFKLSGTVAVMTTAVLASAPAAAQQGGGAGAGERVVGLRAEPSEIVVESGQAVSLTVTPLDAAGNPVTAPLRIAGPRSGVRITRRGSSALERDVTGRAAGRYEIVVSVVLRPDAEGEPATLRIPVTVTWPAVTRIEISAEPGRLYAGTTLRHSAVRTGHGARGGRRRDQC